MLLPRLGAPGHHRAAVAGLTTFVRDAPPAGLVFLDAPPPTAGQAWDAFADVVAGFRAVYAGPIGVHQPHRRHGEPPPDHRASRGPVGLDGLGGLEITPLPALAPVAAGWVTAPPDPARAPGGVIGCAQRADTCMATASTGRMRLTARAEPGTGGRARSWIAMECGTLAADPKPGTLGFALLAADINDGARVATAYPIWMDPDGSFTHHGIQHNQAGCSPPAS